MRLSFEAVTADNTIKTDADFTVPAKATHVELQADTNDIRYTMDNTTNPTTSSGFLLRTADPPQLFLIEDFLRIKFIRDGAANAVLNAHFIGGRNV